MCNIYTLIIPILSELVFYTANVNTEIKSFLQRPYFFQHLRFLNQKKKKKDLEEKNESEDSSE